MLVSELVRQQRILYHSDCWSIPNRIVSLNHVRIRPVVQGKAKSNIEFGIKITISVTDEGFTFLDRLSFSPYDDVENLKAQARALTADAATIQK